MQKLLSPLSSAMTVLFNAFAAASDFNIAFSSNVDPVSSTSKSGISSEIPITCGNLEILLLKSFIFLDYSMQ